MTDTAVAARYRRLGVARRIDLRLRDSVVAEVRGTGVRLVLARQRSARPQELERQQQKQDADDERFHGSSRTCGAVSHDHAADADADGRHALTKSSAAPTVMLASAALNAGHCHVRQ